MPRQVRIEFAGAVYHVMARGDRREPIVRDDEDRRTFLRTLGEACERAGFRVHAYVLMTNHYHLLLETKEPNLSRGMGWLQNAFTRRIKTRHRLWGMSSEDATKRFWWSRETVSGRCLITFISIRCAPDW
jgi:REP-associated tyrosine transposase